MSIKKYIDLSQFPRSNCGEIIWKESVGKTANFIYNTTIGTIKIIEMINSNRYKIKIYINNETIECNCSSKTIRNCSFGTILKKPVAVTHPEFINYFVNKEEAYKYTANSRQHVSIMCPVCGYIKDMVIYVLINYGFSCPRCSDGVSYPNKLMYNVLSQLNIFFDNEVSKKKDGFDWIDGDYRYDFYVPYNDQKMLIEMDGSFHKGSCFNSYEEVHQVDQHKDIIAINNGYDIIRIDCCYKKIAQRFEYIKNNILCSKLGNLFDFSKIDWGVANKLASTSNIKVAADLWNNNKYCPIDIAKQMRISRDTARGYLKIAADIGLCNYNEEEVNSRMIKRISQNNKNKSKPIALYKDNVIIGVFCGVCELDEKSNELYGIHIDFRNAHAVCNGKKKQVYGYTMKYITKEEYSQLYPQFNLNNTKLIS